MNLQIGFAVVFSSSLPPLSWTAFANGFFLRASPRYLFVIKCCCQSSHFLRCGCFEWPLNLIKTSVGFQFSIKYWGGDRASNWVISHRRLDDVLLADYIVLNSGRINSSLRHRPNCVALCVITSSGLFLTEDCEI